MKGTKKARVHKVFSDRLQELAAQNNQVAASADPTVNRPWFVPEALTTSLQDVATLHEPAFNRDDINTNYAECYQNAEDPGTTGDVIALKLQVDYNASEERAFRYRHASTARCLAHAAGRRYGDGVGPTFPTIEEAVAETIAAGAVE